MIGKKIICLLVGVLLSGTVSVRAMAPKNERLTMLVIPARYSVVQVAMDVAARYEDYAEARFIGRIPAQVIMIGGDDMLPASLIDATGWCPTIMGIPSIDTATLINSLGEALSFRDRDWAWFAGRYDLNLLDLNRDKRADSWYDHPFLETKDREQTRA